MACGNVKLKGGTFMVSINSTYETKRGASAHKCVCCLAVCRYTNCLFFSNFYGISMNFWQFFADCAYFCRFSASSETLRQILVVFTKKGIIKTCKKYPVCRPQARVYRRTTLCFICEQYFPND